MSPSRPAHRAPVWLLVGLFATVTLAGCLGDDGGGGGGTTDPGSSPSPTQSTGPSPTNTPGYNEFKENETETRERVPEAHYHHYWGDASFVTVFDGDVSLDFDACFDSSQQQQPECFGPQPHFGSVVFGLEDDGSQVTTDQDQPTLAGHADTVFTGTSHLEITFEWDAGGQPLIGEGFIFYYKAANSQLFQPQGGIPITVQDPTATIPLKAGMADPAHQIWVSRWEFMLVANSGPTTPAGPWQIPAYLANGTVGVDMIAFKGGRSSIDPPHPDHWDGQEMVKFGVTSGSFAVQSVTLQEDTTGLSQEVMVQESGQENIEMPLKSIVPAGTDYLQVTAWVNATDELSPNLDWALKYHGANTPVYTVLTEYEDGGDGARVYKLYLNDAEVDPPYEKQSFFRFGFVPVLAQAEQVGTGTYEADFALAFEVHKKADFSYYF